MTNSIEEVGELTFFNCTSLERVEISRNLSVIRGGVFGNCTSLEKITIPMNVKTSEYVYLYDFGNFGAFR